jgi:hypothetical protein
VERSAPDTPVMTELWFECIFPSTRTRNWSGQRRGDASLAESEGYHQVNPPSKQIRALQGWLKMVEPTGDSRKPAVPLRLHRTPVTTDVA